MFTPTQSNNRHWRQNRQASNWASSSASSKARSFTYRQLESGRSPCGVVTEAADETLRWYEPLAPPPLPPLPPAPVDATTIIALPAVAAQSVETVGKIRHNNSEESTLPTSRLPNALEINIDAPNAAEKTQRSVWALAGCTYSRVIFKRGTASTTHSVWKRFHCFFFS